MEFLTNIQHRTLHAPIVVSILQCQIFGRTFPKENEVYVVLVSLYVYVMWMGAGRH